VASENGRIRRTALIACNSSLLQPRRATFAIVVSPEPRRSVWSVRSGRKHAERGRRGMEWLVDSTGSESRPLGRLAQAMRPEVVEFDARLAGWPWQTRTSAWVEPTAHALMALRRALPYCHAAAMRDRVARRILTGERMLLDRRCRDGGWNYGNRRVLSTDLPSYPETSALALMALDGHPGVDWPLALAHVGRLWLTARSPLARAWLGACLTRYGEALPESPHESATGDVLVAALEAIEWNRTL